MKVQALTYTIPNLSPREIIEYLGENGFNIAENDLLQPNIQYIHKLYDGILSVFVEEKLLEEVEESVSIIWMYKRMKIFLERIGFGVFQMRDILFPETARLIKILSTVINFSLFKESKRHVYNRIYRRREELETQIEESQAEISNLTKTLQTKREEKAMHQQIIKQTSKDLLEKETEIINYHRVQQGLVNEIEETKRKQAEITERIASEKYQLMSLSQEITRLQAKIVKNPEQLKELLIGMKAQLLEEKASLKDHEKRISCLNKGKIHFKSAVEELKSLICTISLGTEYKTRLTAINIQLNQLTHTNTTLEIENKANTSKRSLLQRKIQYIIDKMNILTEEDNQRMTGMKKDFERLREKHANVIEQRESTQLKIQENNRQIKDLEKEIIQLEAAHQSNLAVVYSDLVSKKNFLLGYSEDLEKVFKGEYLLTS
ncbi:kinetochore protein Nuf2 [Nematocida sp. AWRm80]|nr:kinetochore protein Nuf2 [Nematocida sp. AWRm80]